MIDTKLKDKVVILTGANHGIGAARAEQRINFIAFSIGKEIK